MENTFKDGDYMCIGSASDRNYTRKLYNVRVNKGDLLWDEGPINSTEANSFVHSYPLAKCFHVPVDRLLKEGVNIEFNNYQIY